MPVAPRTAAELKARYHALRQALPPASAPVDRADWLTWSRSPEGRAILSARGRRNGQLSAARARALAAYEREHPDAAPTEPLAWLEEAA